MSAAGAAMGSSEQTSPQPRPVMGGQVCLLQTARQSTMTKVCYYNCTGTLYATTVGAADLCPATIQP